MVTESRRRNIAVAALAAPRFDLTALFAMFGCIAVAVLESFLMPYTWANFMSFQTPSGTFTRVVVAKVIKPAAEASNFLHIVSDPLATVYVAAYSVQIRPNGTEKINRGGFLSATIVCRLRPLSIEQCNNDFSTKALGW